MKKLIVGKNDLETENPQIAQLWHPTKNGNLKPCDFTSGSGKRIWWFLPYTDSNTGKHFDFEWHVPIRDCVKSGGCPYLAKSKPAVWVGFNDLESNYPELAKEWHPTKNGSLRPIDVTVGSEKKVWWYLPYDDSQTGKHFEFEWEMNINKRTTRNFGCPFLSGRAVWPGFNDLATVFPELAREWHPTKNGSLMPTDVTAYKNKKVWWYLPYDDPKTGKHFDFEWEASIMGRSQGNGCPYLSGREVWPGFNDLETVFPDVAKEWHPCKNGTLLPKDVTSKSEKEIWWFHPYDDLKTGKHFDFEWKTKVAYRIQESECPYIRNRLVWRGYNDLATTNPELLEEWHPSKNGSITPYNITSGYGKSVWWYLPYDDPSTGKHFDFEWKTTILHRIEGNGCPFLSGQAIMQGFNDLATTNPDLADQWHPTKNGKVTPYNITAKTTKKFYWYLPYDDPKTGKHFDFEWKTSIINRARGHGCPYLINQAVWVGYNDLVTTNPELIKEWDFEKNIEIEPTDVTAGSNKSVWWRLIYPDSVSGITYTFEWKAKIIDRTQGAGCPQLSQSSGEQAINKYLHARKIPFKYEKSFKMLTGTGNRELSYDFAIKHDTVGWILIEYQGMQHYKSIKLWGGDEQFERQKEHDKRKRKFAKEAGYVLIEVKYTYSTYQSIEAFLDEKLKDLL